MVKLHIDFEDLRLDKQDEVRELVKKQIKKSLPFFDTENAVDESLIEEEVDNYISSHNVSHVFEI